VAVLFEVLVGGHVKAAVLLVDRGRKDSWFVVA